jgi:phage shock protein A
MMGLLNRLNMLAKADAHGVVDAIEDRSLLLKQHVREAELELNRKRARLGALQAEHETLEEDSRRTRDKIKSLDEDVTLAVEGGKDDLARFAIKKLLPLRRRLKHMEERLKEVGKEQESLSEMLTEQEGEFESLRAHVRAYLAQAGTPSELTDPFCEPLVEDEEVEIELLRRMQPKKKGAN